MNMCVERGEMGTGGCFCFWLVCASRRPRRSRPEHVAAGTFTVPFRAAKGCVERGPGRTHMEGQPKGKAWLGGRSAREEANQIDAEHDERRERAEAQTTLP